jgi:hypothetical protein
MSPPRRRNEQQAHHAQPAEIRRLLATSAISRRQSKWPGATICDHRDRGLACRIAVLPRPHRLSRAHRSEHWSLQYNERHEWIVSNRVQR